jgi:hypothetical protein
MVDTITLLVRDGSPALHAGTACRSEVLREVLRLHEIICIGDVVKQRLEEVQTEAEELRRHISLVQTARVNC